MNLEKLNLDQLHQNLKVKIKSAQDEHVESVKKSFPNKEGLDEFKNVLMVIESEECVILLCHGVNTLSAISLHLLTS